jgi:hypothetical protein
MISRAQGNISFASPELFGWPLTPVTAAQGWTPAAQGWAAPAQPALPPALAAWSGLDAFSRGCGVGQPGLGPIARFPGITPSFSGVSNDPCAFQQQLTALALLLVIGKLIELLPGRDLGTLGGASPGAPGSAGGGMPAPAAPGSAPVPGGAPANPAGNAPGVPAPAPGAPPTRPGAPGVAGQRVLVLGDSLMVGARDATTRALEGAGAAGVTVDAQVGRAMNASGAGKHLSPAEIRQQVEASGATRVVIELGSNHADYARFVPETMNELAKLVPPPEVVWVNTQTQRPQGSAYPQSYYDQNARINEVLAREAARHPNLRIADWSSIAGRPGINAGDGLHLTAAGSRELAALILATLQGGR